MTGIVAKPSGILQPQKQNSQFSNVRRRPQGRRLALSILKFHPGTVHLQASHHTLPRCARQGVVAPLP